MNSLLSEQTSCKSAQSGSGKWTAKRGARVNTISAGIIFTLLARDELSGPRGEGYRRMIDMSTAGRGGTPDEVGTVGALPMGEDGAFITGSDFLMDGAVNSRRNNLRARLLLVDPFAELFYL